LYVTPVTAISDDQCFALTAPSYDGGGAHSSFNLGPHIQRPYFFREVRFHKQQSRRRSPTPDGFAFVPLRAVFSDSIVRVVERAVK